MSAEDKATPRPWAVGEELSCVTVITKSDGRKMRVATINGHPQYPGVKDDAELIVRAVNAHDDLVAALEPFAAFGKLAPWPGSAWEHLGEDAQVLVHHDSGTIITIGDFKRAVAAIAKVKGE